LVSKVFSVSVSPAFPVSPVSLSLYPVIPPVSLSFPSLSSRNPQGGDCDLSGSIANLRRWTARRRLRSGIAAVRSLGRLHSLTKAVAAASVSASAPVSVAAAETAVTPAAETARSDAGHASQAAVARAPARPRPVASGAAHRSAAAARSCRAPPPSLAPPAAAPARARAGAPPRRNPTAAVGKRLLQGRIAPELPAARTFREDFALGKQLGKGSYSTVHECEASAGSRRWPGRFAVKVVAKQGLTASDVAGLASEIKILQGIKHPNVLKLLDVYEERDHW